jgi:hypothetical protein
MRNWMAGLALAATLGGQALAQTPAAAPVDWGQALRQDAQALHDVIADSHPGPVDAENPAFKPFLEDGLRTALGRAKTARTYEDWYFALQQYSASFDDAHLALTAFRPNPNPWRAYWPGFLTIQRGEVNVVSFNRDPAAPPLGAVLVSCDGQAADAFAARFIGDGLGRWNLKARREVYSNTLFVDQTNPYVHRPDRCVFKVDGAQRTFDLRWRDLPDAVRDEGLATGRNMPFTSPIGLRPFGGHGVWIGLGSFESEAGNPETLAMTALQARVDAEAEALRDADILVFDLRGNRGGSSAYVTAMARSLWGDDWVSQHVPRAIGVDWRASQANLDLMTSYLDEFADNPTVLAWVKQIVAGMTQARAEGKDLWRQGGREAAADTPAAAPATTAMRARAYVLTDYNCVSACLDAVDTLTAVGAVHVGQETSADTVYMDVRQQALPGGRVSVVVPMKVYRGRARGNNVTAVPKYQWTGALSDTAGIEAWIVATDAAR